LSPFFVVKDTDENHVFCKGESVSSKKKKQSSMSSAELCALIEKILDDKKADNIVTLNLIGKTSITDYMIIASGQSARQVGAMAEAVQVELKAHGLKTITEGMPQCDWVLIDAFDVVVHLFRPEVRAFYNLEKMWSVEMSDTTTS
jgi:ribosome-associated protein